MSHEVITILGAGAMGSALATPLRHNGHEVRLWGTWLDDDLIAACRAGRPHPRTQVPLAEGVQLFEHAQLAEAMDRATLVVLAVASDGVEAVARRALPHVRTARAILLTSKGFAVDDAGDVQLLPRVLRELAPAGTSTPPVVAVGGPCKANEVAAARPTAAVFACTDVDLANDCAAAFTTASYRISCQSDEDGVELCAAMKNVYAIALGVADGLGERDDLPWHDLKAAAFAQATAELALLAGRFGGTAATAYGLAGVGDLEVTGLSGRNKMFGARVGRGEPPVAALEAMRKAEQTVEGVAACDLAVAFVRARDPELLGSLPLLTAVAAVLAEDEDPATAVIRAALP